MTKQYKQLRENKVTPEKHFWNRRSFIQAMGLGRTCGTYTGLWEEFCRDIAANFRDTDYPELLRKVGKAMDATESVMSQKQAQQAIQVCRAELLGKWA